MVTKLTIKKAEKKMKRTQIYDAYVMSQCYTGWSYKDYISLVDEDYYFIELRKVVNQSTGKASKLSKNLDEVAAGLVKGFFQYLLSPQ